MKKLILFIILIGSLFILSCSNNNLNCKDYITNYNCTELGFIDVSPITDEVIDQCETEFIYRDQNGIPVRFMEAFMELRTRNENEELVRLEFIDIYDSPDNPYKVRVPCVNPGESLFIYFNKTEEKWIKIS